MMQGQLGENALTFRSECEQYFTPVVAGTIATHVSSGLKAVDQLNCAVVADLHAVRQFADAWTHSGGHAFDGQHELILASFQSCFFHRALAEMQKFADLEAEL